MHSSSAKPKVDSVNIITRQAAIKNFRLGGSPPKADEPLAQKIANNKKYLYTKNKDLNGNTIVRLRSL